ncbi:hypothetical protein L6452_00754 [Arctium lappa]|uniref:Uncharacterized protein n=1 Tax=Arctium lappa TaxID=4217 RepID=A0ACB9FFL6_ARCLA|nr:hypothetical protein L6452_00754 [Arctium lappa]
MKEISMTKSDSPSLKEVEEIIGYIFKNKDLLKEAFTYTSKEDDIDGCRVSNYERLEYLGDSFLNLMIAKQHYFQYPNMKSGELTQLRDTNVDTEALARVAFKHGFHRFLVHQDPLLHERIQDFMEAIKEHPLHSSGLINSPKILADVVESLIGAVYVDTNLSIDDTWEAVKKLLEPLTVPENVKLNPVRRLNETCQKMGIEVEYKNLWVESGEFEIYLGNKLMGRGKYKKKKKTARNKAAVDAYNNLVKQFGVDQLPSQMNRTRPLSVTVPSIRRLPSQIGESQSIVSQASTSQLCHCATVALCGCGFVALSTLQSITGIIASTSFSVIQSNS